MSDSQPMVLSATSRQFATSPIAVQAIVVDSEERVLLLNHPQRQKGWQVVSGALEAGETVLAGVLREIREEIGEAVFVRPLGIVHADTFHYDEKVKFMIAIYYLFVYESGSIVPGDDMEGSEFRWWHLDELSASNVALHATAKPWLLERAVDLIRKME
jgi:NADH pyrophosphatase NudC (nudix superfamily)